MDRLESLRVFCQVVELNSFSRAAEQLELSNASITNHIASLERHFGVRLLNRTTRKLSLTDDGHRCYQRAQRLLGDMIELEDTLQGSRATPQGVLRIDVPTVISRIYLAPALSRFTARYPDLTLRVNVSDRMVDMVEGRGDVWMRIGELKDSSMVARRVYQTKNICCAAPDFLRRHGIPATPQDLTRFQCLSFIHPSTGQNVPWTFSKGKQQIEWTPQTSISINHAESLIHAASSGAGIVQLLSLSLNPAIRSGLLTPVLTDWSTAGPPVSVLYHHSHQLSAKIRVFVDFVTELFAEIDLAD
ncbi:LysR family transcriptional regulator [Glaciimonas sp. PCH181]|uniref:LysR family transcriptional regulator n=1 Tax=Glaciimonas sp. PCH181 TaxID=2133943 RepID=UPI000D35E506|nr:LysR family transcriptional regulator [Glaciimonas sp. PCH181]PUA16747.1 LysR family transcriptional regulator [Glaciimonas sp. PCH181]